MKEIKSFNELEIGDYVLKHTLHNKLILRKVGDKVLSIDNDAMLLCKLVFAQSKFKIITHICYRNYHLGDSKFYKLDKSEVKLYLL